MGKCKQNAYLLYMALVIFTWHFTECYGSSRNQEGKDTSISFNQNYTGVYFDPVDFMRYNGLTHTLDETGLAALVQKIHSTFDHIMVPYHVLPTTAQDSSNQLLPETVARENVRLNGSIGNKSRSFIKLILLCKVNDWRDITIIKEQVQRLRNVAFSANSIFPGTVKSVILEMRNGTNEAYQNFAMFRQFFLNQSPAMKDPHCTFGLQLNIETSATVLIDTWNWKDNLQNVPDTTYFSEYFNGDIDGVSATTYLDTLKGHFGSYRRAINNLKNSTEICFMATWPDTGVEGQVKYSELANFWGRINDWALDAKTLVIFFQAFDTPFDPEERMMTNGWWRLLPNSSYRHPSQFIFEEKTSLGDILSDKETLHRNMEWLRQEPQFSRDNTAVVFNPDILRYIIDKPNPYSNASLKALVQHISTKFSKILISTTELSFEDMQGILLVPQIVARMNLNGTTYSDKPMEVIMKFNEVSVNSVTNVTRAANKIFPGVVRQLIYHPTILIDKVKLVTHIAKIEEVAGGFFGMGIQTSFRVCADHGDFMDYMKLYRSSLNSIPSQSKFLHIPAYIPYQHTKLGADRLLPIYTAVLENCKRKIENYFRVRNESIKVTFLTEWPRSDDKEVGGLQEFVRFWETMNKFALFINSTVIFSSAFDGANGDRKGWWNLMENETFPETVNDFLFEDKKQAALRHAEEYIRDVNSSTPITISLISAVILATLLIAVILSMVCYLRATRNSKYLSNEEIAAFFNGWDEHVDGVKGPYKKSHLEISRKSFTVHETSLLGSGAFGKVCRGTLHKEKQDEQELEVAVKLTKVPCPQTAFRALLIEIKILSYLGSHPHIVELLGAYTAELRKSRAFVILELCALGSLESYLRKQRPDEEAALSDDASVHSVQSMTEYMTPDKKVKLDETLATDMCSWAGEIATGMEFIASKHIVHLDIASRNILLTADKRAKITDFGLSRRLYDYQTYVKKEQAPLPWKWMAPESLRKSEFTEKSDVWGFGVLLWEIYSLGDEPYPGLSFHFNFAGKLENGLRLGRPTYNENEIYLVMLRCWSTKPEIRPTFSELTQRLCLVSPPESDRQSSDSAGDELAVTSVPIQQSSSPDMVVSNQLPRQTDNRCGDSLPTRVKVGCSNAGYCWSSLSVLLSATLTTILILTLTNYRADDDSLTNTPMSFHNSTAELNESHNHGNWPRPTTERTLTTTTTIAPSSVNNETVATVSMETLNMVQESGGNRKDAALGEKLFSYIKQNDVKNIAIILQFDADPNQWNDEKETPIIRAAHVPDIMFSFRIIRLLVDHGADVYARDKENRTFLHILVSRRYITPAQFHDIAEYIISKNHSTISLFVMEGWVEDDILLHIAIGRLEVQKRTLTLLYENGVDFNILSKDGNNVLAYATLGGRSQELMTDLMKFGADCKHLNKDRWNFLHFAAQSGLVDGMAFLLNAEFGLDVNAQDNVGYAPLHLAILFATEDIFQIVQLLIDRGAKVKINDSKGRSPLQIAKNHNTMIDKEDVVKLLSDREIAEEKPGILGARLFDLIKQENEQQVRVLVEYGADLNIRNDRMETPLFGSSSAYCSNSDLTVCLRIAKYLIERGADVYARATENRTFLHDLVAGGTTLSPSQFHDISSYLISKNLSEIFNAHAFYFGATPLHVAVRYLDEIENRTLFLLHGNGVNLNMLDYNEYTILKWSVLGRRSVTFLSNLVAVGVNWTQRDSNNRSLIHDLAKLGHADGLKYFLSLGLDSNAIDANGDSPLHTALLLRNNNILEIIQILIENGASVMTTNNHGRTPLDEAVLRIDYADKQAVVQLLEETEIAQEDTATLGKRLLDAIGNLNEERVKVLVEFGADLNMRNGRMETPLFRTTYCCTDDPEASLRIAKYLIERGADVYARDVDNWTFLHHLFSGGTKLSSAQFHDISSYIISKNMSELFNTLGQNGVTPLHFAVFNMDEIENRTLTLLESNGVNFNSLDGFHNSILKWSIDGGRSVGFLSKLVDLGANWKLLTKYKSSLIHVSAMSGHIDGLKYFISLGLEVDALDATGNTPLHRIISFGQNNVLEAIQILIENGASVLIRNNNGRTPLEEAILRNDLVDKQAVVELLRDSELSGETPQSLGEKLFAAIRNKNEEFVKVLVEFGADVNIRNGKMMTPLLRSTYCSDEDLSVCIRIVKYLIENNADVYARYIFDYTFLHYLVDGRTILSPAQFHDISSYLISKNMSELFNAGGSNGATPLHFAVKNIEVENRTMTLLKSNGVNFTSLNNLGSSILSWAVEGGRSVGFLSTLIALGANWTKPNIFKSSLIHGSAFSGHIDGLKYFISLGLDVNAIDASGNAPLHTIVSFGKRNILETIQILIENGASVLIRNNNGRTPLDEAVLRRDFIDKQVVIQLLIEAEFSGGNPEALGERLFDAIENGNEDLVKVLVQFGADINIRNDEMESPLLGSPYCSDDDLSVCIRIAKYLIEKGADVYAGDTDNATFLHYLVAGGSKLSPFQFHDISSYLISKNMSELFNARSSNGITPLHLAVENVDEVENRTLTLLKNYGVKFSFLDSLGSSILVRAVIGGRGEIFLSNLVKLGVNWTQLDKYNRSLLHASARSGHIDGLKYFVTQGLDVDAADAFGDTPLHKIALFGNNNTLEAISFLIENGASALIRNNYGRTPLEEAALRRYFIDKQAVIQLLREAELSQETPERLGEKLFAAIRNKNEELVRVLVEFGTDVNIQNARMETPLFSSKYCSDEDLSVCIRIVKYLIKRGADVYARDTKNRTFLHSLIASKTTLSPFQFHDMSSYLISKNWSELFNTPDSNGVTPLHFAVRNIDEVENRTLIVLQKNGVNFNSLDSFDNSILTWAVHGERSANFLSTLVELGANWKQLDKYNSSLIHDAAFSGNVGGLKYLLNLGLDVDAVDIAGVTPLHRTVLMGEKNTLEIIKLLIARGANTLIKATSGRIPLEEAIQRDAFTDKQAVVQLLEETELSGETLERLGEKLFEAIANAKDDLVKVLVKLDADVNIRNVRMETPIFSSTHCSKDDLRVCLKIAKYLIEEGADVYARDINNRTFLHELFGKGTALSPFQFHDISSYLISKNHSGLFNMLGPNGINPLHLAVAKIDEVEKRTLKLLKSNGINFNSLDSFGNSILTWSIFGSRSVSFLTKLIELGANWKQLDMFNRSLIHASAFKGHIDGLKYFISLGLDVDAIDMYGDTPLHHTVLFGRKHILDTLKLLIAHGANVLRRNGNGRTPLEEAVQRNDSIDKQAVVQFLREMESVVVDQQKE